ncbi:DUF4168 domain-containing protein [Reyranella sp.]|uniref:DUF4168 domain-containing protein n=1 Tax=Reyranella sp. TaxID=1929291 RepID=UPI001205120F|nr:DUF4168 domain-containing protein [Reyranella sp.]TAJ89369.1 MAG: DUF4168 domain-containing protein [Reyranella sp.]
MKSITGLCVTTLAAAGLFLLPAANAQQQSPSPSTSPPTKSAPASPASIPDSKLDAAAAAVKSVSAVKDNYKQKIAQAPAADRERIAGEADTALIKAVTDKGLSVEEYTTILEVAQTDPVVKDKLVQRLK